MEELHIIVIASLSNDLLFKDGWREGMAVKRTYNTYCGDTFDLDVFGPFETYPSSGQAFREMAKRATKFVGVKFRVQSFRSTG